MRNTSKYLLWMILLTVIVLTACSGPSPEKIYQQIPQSTVEVIVDTATTEKLGTGFFYAPNTVATNYHVISGMQSGYIKIQDGGMYQIESIQGFDAARDIALITVSYAGTPVSVGDKTPETGETVYTLGSSLGLTGTFAEGVISTSERMVDGYSFIQTSAPISSGNSGGPLINAQGKVIGINTASFSDGQNLNLAVPISALAILDTTKPYSVSEFCGLSDPFEALTAFILEHGTDTFMHSYRAKATISALQNDITEVSCTYVYLDTPNRYERYVGLNFNLDDHLCYFLYIQSDSSYTVGVSYGAYGENTYGFATEDGALWGNAYRDISYYSYSVMPWDNKTPILDMSGYLEKQVYIWMDKLIPTFDSWCRMNKIPCTASDFDIY